jgi:hypothetical protein
MSDLPITRGEFNAAIAAVREGTTELRDDMRAAITSLRTEMVERFARVEAYQEMASAQKLEEARDVGRLEQRVRDQDARIHALEKSQEERDAAHRNHMARLHIGLAIAMASGFLALALKVHGG